MCVHATTSDGTPIVLLPCPPRLEIRVAHSDDVGGTAAELIELSLGAEASRYYRAPERAYPLRYEGMYYSVSHTSALTVVAFAAVPIGVDIEYRLPFDAALDMSWALTDEEQREIECGPEEVLTEIWTTKEASGKAVGDGLGSAPHSICTFPVHTTSGRRTSELPRSSSRRLRLVTHGYWTGMHHIRIAWPLSVTLEQKTSKMLQQVTRFRSPD